MAMKGLLERVRGKKMTIIPEARVHQSVPERVALLPVTTIGARKRPPADMTKRLPQESLLPEDTMCKASKLRVTLTEKAKPVIKKEAVDLATMILFQAVTEDTMCKV